MIWVILWVISWIDDPYLNTYFAVGIDQSCVHVFTLSVQHVLPVEADLCLWIFM